MAVHHRTQRLQIYGDKPEVTKLFGGRYRIVVRCTAARDTEAWYNDNKDQIFADFGTLYSAQMSVDGIDSRTGEAYSDMVLVSNSTGYTSAGEYLVTFVYETLTSTWTKEQEDAVSSTENGLRVVERSEVATIGATAPYDEDDIGVSTITSGGKTLYLAGFNDETKADPDAQIGRVVTQWAEAGILNVSKRNMSEGVMSVATTFLAVEGSTTGPITQRSTSDYNGLKTITVTTLQDANGDSIVDGGENLVHQYERKVPWTDPGVISLQHDILEYPVGGTTIEQNAFSFVLDPPVERKVEADVFVIFQTSGDIVASDETYDSADSYWNPDEWASSLINGIGSGFAPINDVRGYRGYRISTDISGIQDKAATGSVSYKSNGVFVFQNKGNDYIESDNNTTAGSLSARVYGAVDTNSALYVINGNRLYAASPWLMQLSGGPVDPSGTRYVLDIDIRPAFSDIDGNTYYKKTIVVATV